MRVRLRNDLLQLAGGAAVVAGIGMIYLPAGFIAGGLVLFAAGVVRDLIVPKPPAPKEVLE